MKKGTYHMLALATLCALMLSSCASLPKRMENYADKTEKYCEDFSIEDWKDSATEFNGMVKEFAQDRAKYSMKQKSQASKATAKFYTLLATSAVSRGADYVNAIKDEVPAYLKGLLEGVKEGSSGLEGKIRDLLGGDWIQKIQEAVQDFDFLGDSED